MLSAFSDVKSNVPNDREWFVRLVGNSTSAPTFGVGSLAGVTLSRSGTGDYKVTWKESPGNYAGVTWGLQSSSPTGLKNYSVIFKDWDATNRVLEVLVFNSTGTAADLATTDSLTLRVTFAATSITY